MYKVKIINEGKSLIINDVSTSSNAPRIEGTIKKGINTIDSFEFTIFPNNPGFNSIYALTTLIEIENTITNKLEFKGRVLLPKENMSSKGLFYKTVTCESEMAYLLDSNQIYGEYHNISVKNFLEKIISNHNGFVSEDKWFKVGTVTVKDNNDSLYKYLSYEDKTLDTIKEKLIKVLGGELQIRYENGIRYLDYLEEVGEQKETKISLGKNLESINRENNPTSIITRLIPLGNKLEDDQRLTIKEVNNGIAYVDDEEAIKRYGIITGCKTWDDVTEASNLLRKGREFLKSNNKVVRKNSLSALDLSLIGLDIDTFEVGNTYLVVNPVLNISEYLRVIEKTIDINAPHKSSLTIGDKYISMTEIQSNEKKGFQYNRIQVQAAIDKINKTLGKVVVELAETQEGLQLKISEDDFNTLFKQTTKSFNFSIGNEEEGTNVLIDKEGLTIKNGAIAIKNSKGEVVMWIDENGHLTTDTLEVFGNSACGVNLHGKGAKYVHFKSDDNKSLFMDFYRGETGHSRMGIYAEDSLSERSYQFFIEPGSNVTDKMPMVIVRGINSTAEANEEAELQVHGRIRAVGKLLIGYGSTERDVGDILSDFAKRLQILESK
ncbi:MAG: phage tail protein [Clostridium sp.]|nr:phage tail protein [Clostridium sp.]